MKFTNMPHLLFIALTIITLSSTTADDCKHICECLPPKVPSSTENSLESCLRLQGLFGDRGTVYLIASDCVYTIKLKQLMSIRDSRLFLFDRKSKILIEPVPWFIHARYRNLVASKEPGYFTKATRIAHHSIFLNREPSTQKLIVTEIVDFENPLERYFLQYGQLVDPLPLGRFSGLTFNGVINSFNGNEGYLLVLPYNGTTTGATTFYNHEVLFDQNSFKSYLLQFNPERKVSENDSEARFVRVEEGSTPPDKDQGWKSIPSSAGFPLGIQLFTWTILIDAHDEKVYIFNTFPLGSFDDDFLWKPFPLKAMPLRDFLTCKPNVNPEPPAQTSIGIFLVISILGVVCLVSVTTYAFCRRSMISGDVVRNSKRQNIKYRYWSFGRRGAGGGGSIIESLEGTAAPSFKKSTTFKKDNTKKVKVKPLAEMKVKIKGQKSPKAAGSPKAIGSPKFTTKKVPFVSPSLTGCTTTTPTSKTSDKTRKSSKQNQFKKCHKKE